MERTETKTERNKQLKKDYHSGKFTTVELVKKYNISTARIYQIVNREGENNG